MRVGIWRAGFLIISHILAYYSLSLKGLSFLKIFPIIEKAKKTGVFYLFIYLFIYYVIFYFIFCWLFFLYIFTSHLSFFSSFFLICY